MLFKLSNLNSNVALTLGYLNPALNNSAQASELQVQRSNYLATMPPPKRECETVIGRILIDMN